jgi:translation initiation factor 4E
MAEENSSAASANHPLQGEYALWFDSKNKSRASWEDNLNKVYSFKTVEDFWGFVTVLVYWRAEKTVDVFACESLSYMAIPFPQIVQQHPACFDDFCRLELLSVPVRLEAHLGGLFFCDPTVVSGCEGCLGVQLCFAFLGRHPDWAFVLFCEQYSVHSSAVFTAAPFITACGLVTR